MTARGRWLLVAHLGALGCGRADYGSLDVYVLSGDDAIPGYTTQVVVPRGGALFLEAHPRAAGGDEFRGWEQLELRSMSPAVAEIRRSILSDTWVVTGTSPGQATVVVELDGRREDRFTVTVVEQD